MTTDWVGDDWLLINSVAGGRRIDKLPVQVCFAQSTAIITHRQVHDLVVVHAC